MAGPQPAALVFHAGDFIEVWTEHPELGCLASRELDLPGNLAGARLFDIEISGSIAADELAVDGELPSALRYDLFPQQPGAELVEIGETGFRVTSEDGELLMRWSMRDPASLSSGLARRESMEPYERIEFNTWLSAYHSDLGLTFEFVTDIEVEGDDSELLEERSAVVLYHPGAPDSVWESTLDRADLLEIDSTAAVERQFEGTVVRYQAGEAALAYVSYELREDREESSCADDGVICECEHRGQREQRFSGWRLEEPSGAIPIFEPATSTQFDVNPPECLGEVGELFLSIEASLESWGP